MELHNKALDRAKIALLSRPDSAFYSTICFSLKHIWDDTVPTACTDGTSIRYNPTFFMNLPAPQQLFLLMHEVSHVCFQHMARLLTRDHARWNIAADHLINLQLIERGFKMIPGGLADPQYKNLSTDEIYNLLPEDAGDGGGYDLDIQPGEGDAVETKAALDEILVRAAIQSKLSGDAPGTISQEIQIYLDNFLNPKLPWQRILQKYLHNMAKSDFSFRKPNRRFFPKYHLPSLHSESLADLTIAVDTSGSVSDAEFKQFISEIVSIFKMMKPEFITLLQFDTKLHHVTKIRNIRELMAVKFTGRGGTCITEIVDYVDTNKTQLLLVFTDGEFDSVEKIPRTNTVWLIHGNDNFVPQFGKQIKYTI